ANLDPRTWSAEIRGLLAKRRLGLGVRDGINGLPADFLIAPDGEVIARTYGTYAYDQWSVDELLALVPERVGEAEKRQRRGGTRAGATWSRTCVTRAPHQIRMPSLPALRPANTGSSHSSNSSAPGPPARV